MQPCFVLKNPTSYSVLGWLQVRAGEMVGNSALRSAWREQLSTGIAFTTALQCPTFSGLKEGWKRKVTKVSHSKPLKYRILSLIPPFFSNLYQSVHHPPLLRPLFQQGELRPEASASKGDCSLAQPSSSRIHGHSDSFTLCLFSITRFIATNSTLTPTLTLTPQSIPASHST